MPLLARDVSRRDTLRADAPFWQGVRRPFRVRDDAPFWRGEAALLVKELG